MAGRASGSERAGASPPEITVAVHPRDCSRAGGREEARAARGRPAVSTFTGEDTGPLVTYSVIAEQGPTGA